MAGNRERASGARLVRVGLPAALVLAGIALWQVVVTAFHVPAYLVPGPGAVWRAAVDERDLLLTNAVPTLQIALLGYLLAVVAGIIVGAAIHLSRVLEWALYPLVIASQTIPIIALAPVLVVVFGFTVLPKLIIVALICVLPIVVNLVDGFRSVDPELVALMRSLGASRLRRFREVEWPSALPYLLSGAKIAVTFSVVGALYGEWAGSNQGLGYLMIQKMAEFDTEIIFAAFVVLALLGMGMFAIVAVLERVLVPWKWDARPRRRGE